MGRFHKYWLVETGAEEELGINGGMFRPDDIFSGTVNTVDVPDADEFIEKIMASGGEIVIEKHTIPGVGCSACSRVVSGILFGIHQEDPQAACSRCLINDSQFRPDLVG